MDPSLKPLREWPERRAALFRTLQEQEALAEIAGISASVPVAVVGEEFTVSVDVAVTALPTGGDPENPFADLEVEVCAVPVPQAAKAPEASEPQAANSAEVGTLPAAKAAEAARRPAWLRMSLSNATDKLLTFETPWTPKAAEPVWLVARHRTRGTTWIYGTRRDFLKVEEAPPEGGSTPAEDR